MPQASDRQSVALPRIAKATIAATICAGLPSCWPSISRKPRPGRGAQEFGRHHEHPAETEARAQREHVGRHHRRQQDAPHHGEARQPECAADLDDLAIDRQHRAHDAEIDRKEHADRDQRDLRGLEDAEPENEQRHPGDRRDRAQRLQRRIDQAMAERRIAGDGAQRRFRRRRRRQIPTARATAWRTACSCSSPVRASSRKVVEDHRRRRHQPPVRPARCARRVPRAAPTRPAAGGRARAAAGARSGSAAAAVSAVACSSAAVIERSDTAMLPFATLRSSQPSLAPGTMRRAGDGATRSPAQFVTVTWRSSISSSTDLLDVHARA